MLISSGGADVSCSGALYFCDLKHGFGLCVGITGSGAVSQECRCGVHLEGDERKVGGVRVFVILLSLNAVSAESADRKPED